MMRRLLDLLYNFHWIAPAEAARSAQSYARFLAPFLKRHGIRAVINLRGRKSGWRWYDYETRVCTKLGVAHHDIALNSRRLPTRVLLLDMLDAFDTAPRPLLIKCSGGQDRTSFAATLYLLHTRGWNAHEEAVRQFARWPFLHLPRQQQRWLKAFFEFAEQTHSAGNLRVWIATEYRPEEFKRWLEAKGLGDAFRGLYASPSAAVKSDERQTA